MKNDYLIETILYRGCNIEVMYDECPESPREWSCLGTMLCFRKRYSLGDEHNYSSNDYDSWDELEQAIIKNENVAVILPLFLYDHGGITMSTGRFSCPWDSGQVGFIYISKEKCLEEYGGKRVTKKLKERVEKYLEGEVETYDTYLQGEIYGYNVEETSDSCYGYFGDDGKEQMIEEAKQNIDYYLEQMEKNLPIAI